MKHSRKSERPCPQVLSMAVCAVVGGIARALAEWLLNLLA
jgi:hypothetical protein